MQIYLRWPQANRSAGKITCECMQKSPQVTSARRYFRWSLYCLCQSGFYHTEAYFLLPGTKQFDENNHLLPLNSMVNSSKFFLFRKKWIVHCWLLKLLSKKYSSLKTFSLSLEGSETSFCHFSTFFTIIEWKKNVMQK